MSRKKLTRVIKKPDSSGYDCVHVINGKTYSNDEIHVLNNVENNIHTREIIDTNTGEIIAEFKTNVISENNSKVFMHANGFEIAKDKNVPREKVLANGKHIIELSQEYSEYLQTSTGSQHDRRGIITVDIDFQLEDSDKSKEEIFEHINSIIAEKINLLVDLKIQKPSAYQIHLTNGHVQLHWVLKEEIQIKKLASRTVYDNGNKRKLYYFQNTNNWGPYMQCLRFLSILMGGDPNFTGWQIKNMFITDETFKNDFITLWLTENNYSINQPADIIRYDFNDLNICVYSFLKDKNSSKTKLVASLLSDKLQNPLYTSLQDELCISNSMKAKLGITKQYKKADIKEGRNQFVRMKTYEVIRAYKNNIEPDTCKRLVKKAFENALKDDGTLPGTKNKSIYSEQDFERDFTGAYYHAITTYNKPIGYTQEQRERSIRQRKSIKNKRHEILLTILEKHPELIPDTKQNCIELRKLIHQVDNTVNIKSNNTISNYKKELGIKKDQKKITHKNYKRLERFWVQRISRQNELISAYNANKNYMSEKSIKEWNKRINDISFENPLKSFKNKMFYKIKSDSDSNDLNYLKSQDIYQSFKSSDTLEKIQILKI